MRPGLTISKGDESHPLVALVTDFGMTDSYVAEMCAVLLRIPGLRILHLSHDLKPGDIEAAGYLIRRSAGILPDYSILLAVVDPGVGSNRLAVVIRNRGKFFIGPDNGIFGPALDWDGPVEVRALTVPEGASATFHGRDLLAPAAVRLAAGDAFEDLGPAIQLIATRRPKRPVKVGSTWFGRVVHIDRFGDVATDIPGAEAGWAVVPGYGRLGRQTHYAAMSSGMPFWLVGSDGCVEIAVQRGNAGHVLNLRPGDPIRLVEE